jgi:undecaprenyl diphosphate synthase
MNGLRLPKHVAIIMDGNGRWAERRGRPRVFGHIKGCGRVREIVREASDLGLHALTLYAFSAENWYRPEDEIQVLMKLLHKWLMRQQKELTARNIRFRAIGQVERLPSHVYELVRHTEETSKRNTGLQLTLALSYSAREELVAAARSLAVLVESGQIRPNQIDEKLMASTLYTAEVGDPDLLIRTSGECRLSNFLLWQLAYAEFLFSSKMWPDFGVDDFRQAIGAFEHRERRFGRTSAQLEIAGAM